MIIYFEKQEEHKRQIEDLYGEQGKVDTSYHFGKIPKHKSYWYCLTGESMKPPAGNPLKNKSHVKFVTHMALKE